MRGRTGIVALTLALVALGGVGWLVYGKVSATNDVSTATTERDQAADNAKSLAEQVADACAKGGPAAAELVRQGACAKAAEVKQEPSGATSTSAPADPGALRQAARTAVAEYCAAPSRPCRGSDGTTPSFDLLVDAVLGRIPTPKDGADGKDATASQVAAVVASYCGQPEEPCRGPQGKQGDSPQCLAEASQCRGADGQPPASWTTDYSDGSTETCSRADPFDSAAPHYTCTRSAPPTDDPPLPLGGS